MGPSRKVQTLLGEIGHFLHVKNEGSGERNRERRKNTVPSVLYVTTVSSGSGEKWFALRALGQVLSLWFS